MDNNIKQIIKSDSDRLFIVDPECIIIYTGDSIDDEKPFIRIGNWINLPVELIPLIENIVVPDRIMGTPSYEQFNIDVRQLSTNRYIGSEKILGRFLDFQKIFGLDLTNASIVNIEKDIPEISKEKKLSSKNHFIGVFYRDGNFKTVHNNNTIIDLKKHIDSSYLFEQAHNELSEENKKSSAFSGSGVIVLEHNPAFFHNRDFITYQFPTHYFETFSQLAIDPKRIKAILHPSINYINVTKLIKWKHITNDNIKIFSDHTHIINLFKNLFPKCNIIHDNFNSLQYNSGDGLSIRNYPGSYNLKLKYRNINPVKTDIAIAFIKGTEGIKEILNDKLDAIFITYSIFEDTNLLFKSSVTPLFIIDDGNKNLAKLFQQDKIILLPGVHYEFQAFTEYEALEATIQLENNIKTSIIENSFSIEEIETHIASLEDPLSRQQAIHNLLSLIMLQLNLAIDRKYATQLKDLNKKLIKEFDRNILKEFRSRYRVNIIFYDNNAYIFLEITNNHQEKHIACDEISEQAVHFLQFKDKTKKFYQQILEDRERLMRLLALLWASEKYTSEYAANVNELAKAIEYRKENFLSNNLSIKIDDLYNEDGELIHSAYSKKKNISQFMDKISNAARELAHFEFKDKNLSHDQSAPDSHGLAKITGLLQKVCGIKKPATPGDPGSLNPSQDIQDKQPVASWNKKRIVILVAVMLVAVTLAVLAMLKFNTKHKSTVADNNNGNNTMQEKDDKLNNAINETRIPIEKKIYDSIKVTDKDIFHYANKIAQKNGYSPIPYKIYGKDPDWIYPGNVFTMHDGEKIIVTKGDTLWGLAKKKLVMMSLRFDSIIQEYQKTGDNNKKQELFSKASSYSFTERNKAIIENLKTGTNNNGKQR